jgi:hypothetical protein
LDALSFVRTEEVGRKTELTKTTPKKKQSAFQRQLLTVVAGLTVKQSRSQSGGLSSSHQLPSLIYRSQCLASLGLGAWLLSAFGSVLQQYRRTIAMCCCPGGGQKRRIGARMRVRYLSYFCRRHQQQNTFFFFLLPSIFCSIFVLDRLLVTTAPRYIFATCFWGWVSSQVSRSKSAAEVAIER